MLTALITKRVNEEGNATKAYAELAIDNCAVIRGIRLMAGKNGAFVSFPQERAYDTATKAPKAVMYGANGAKVKASGSIQVGDFVCRNILVAVRESKQNGETFAAVSYPSYSRETDEGTVYKPYLEFKKDGLAWDEQLQTSCPENYASLARNIIVKAAKEASPELVSALEAGKERKTDAREMNTEIPLHLGQKGR